MTQKIVPFLTITFQSILMNDPCGYDMHNIYPRAYSLNYTIIIHQLIIAMQGGENSNYLLWIKMYVHFKICIKINYLVAYI